MWQEINYTEDPIDLLVPNITYKINPAEIESIEANSIAEEIGFESGDSIISINGKKPRDLIEKFVKMYVNDVTVNMGENGEKSIKKFFDMATEKNLIPKFNLKIA